MEWNKQEQQPDSKAGSTGETSTTDTNVASEERCTPKQDNPSTSKEVNVEDVSTTNTSSTVAEESSTTYWESTTNSDESENRNNYLSPNSVLRDHAILLTSREKEEIHEYQKIYCFGEKNTPVVGGSAITDHIAYRYQIHGTIGQGGYGSVVKAYDCKINEFVAIKLIDLKYTNLQKIYKEIAMLRSVGEISHHKMKNNFVQFKEFFMFRKHVCIIFEELSHNMYEMLRMRDFKPFNIDTVKSLTYSLVESLNLLNRNKIAHCDLKPENMVLEKNNGMNFKLIDFGMSCFLSEIAENRTIQTLYYTAPEVIVQGQITAAVDMWSLGCISAELATGSTLIKGKDEYDQICAIVELLGVPPDEFFETLDSDVVGIYFHANRVPTYCSYQVDQTGKIEMTPNPVRDSPPRVLPGARQLRAALNQTEDKDMIDFISKCLTWMPKDRMTPARAMQHPFVKRRYPHSPIVETMELPTQLSRLYKNRNRNSEYWTDGTQENDNRLNSASF